MLLTSLAAITASVALAAADAPTSERALNQDSLDALAMLDRDPEEFALQQRCLAPHLRFRERVRLSDPVYNERFAWADLTGRNTSVLVQFRRPCDAARFGTPPVPRCTGPVNTGALSPLCIADELYLVPDEHHARALALRILVDEARENGAELPSSNADAAQALIDQSNSSR